MCIYKQNNAVRYVSTLTVCVTESNCLFFFDQLMLFQRAKSSLERTQQLNPMVDVTADDTRPEDNADGYFTEFDVICATCCSSSLLTKIDQICADNNVKFFAGDVFGYYGYMFSDLGEHEYAEWV